MKQRIIGFDLARAYAIFGMFIVNFNIVFGNAKDDSFLGKFLGLFSGNSSTVFVMLAGMGVALMSNRIKEYSAEDRSHLRLTLIKRAAFLFVFGLLFSFWWSADILHLYGCYILIASAILFLDKKLFLIIAIITITVFHVLLMLIPYETGWNLNNLTYLDLWTFKGFLRNTFYNGWNPIFPWFSYFAIGMFLGRLHWTDVALHKKVIITGAALYITIEIMQYVVENTATNPQVIEFFTADYIPPLFPFLLSTTGFGLVIIGFFMLIGERYANKKWAINLAKTGQMTLTHYVIHLTVGLLLISIWRGEHTGWSSPLFVLLVSSLFFVASFYFSIYWTKKYQRGPLESLMRRIAA
ncbi:DUF418 domain-containing protein [Sphingobacterium sp. SRCM116780]|uniref:DUF418 domain-containing protein n=1 Tax=Sphingobacterium sp. SRCM116780 TaxID=2907623 RepID=UPI001F46177B|nr:DUF418 domain-containing protein [Sphingobacterium sp. SRCM116780]UIR54927.1 DUF418 domain-containing protein [Sphingobacterium sp. SRCM116780]